MIKIGPATEKTTSVFAHVSASPSYSYSHTDSPRPPDDSGINCFRGGTMAMMAALASLFLLVTLASSGEILDSRPPLITFLPRNCGSYFEISQKQKTVNTIYCESVNLGFYRLFCGKLFSKEKHINSFLCLFHCLRIESKSSRIILQILINLHLKRN